NKITSVPRKNLLAQRNERPRPVTETPQIFQFYGTNFHLLKSIHDDLMKDGREQLINYVLQRVESSGTRVYSRPANYAFPSFDGMVSELPLVAELCIRTGNVERFFAATAKPTAPTNSSAIMTVQLEETIALNWNLFSNEQLEKIPTWLSPLRET